MRQREIAGGLASGGSYRLTDTALEMMGPTGDLVATFGLSSLSAVRRTGQAIEIARSGQREITITVASEEEAERLELALRQAIFDAVVPLAVQPEPELVDESPPPLEERLSDPDHPTAVIPPVAPAGTLNWQPDPPVGPEPDEIRFEVPEPPSVTPVEAAPEPPTMIKTPDQAAEPWAQPAEPRIVTPPSAGELTGSLASGGRFRLASDDLVITNPAGLEAARFAIADFTSVQLRSQVVEIKRGNQSPITVTSASVDDAAKLANQLTSRLSGRPGFSGPVSFPSSDTISSRAERSNNRWLIWAGIGAGVLLLLCIICTGLSVILSAN
jgi:hypothetical protein